MTTIRTLLVLALAGNLSACGGNKEVDYTCDEPQRYQAVAENKRIEPPEGLDPLDEFAEMPVPRAQDAPVRQPGSRCIELPPPIQAGN